MGQFVNCKQLVPNEDGHRCALGSVGNLNNFMTRGYLMQHREIPGFRITTDGKLTQPLIERDTSLNPLSPNLFLTAPLQVPAKGR